VLAGFTFPGNLGEFLLDCRSDFQLDTGPPVIGTIQKLGLGEISPTQTVSLFASGYQAAEAADSLFCAMNSARTSRGAVPSSWVT